MSGFTRSNCGLGHVTYEGVAQSRRDAERMDEIKRTKFETSRMLLKAGIRPLTAKRLSDNFTRSEIAAAFKDRATI